MCVSMGFGSYYFTHSLGEASWGGHKRKHLRGSLSEILSEIWCYVEGGEDQASGKTQLIDERVHTLALIFFDFLKTSCHLRTILIFDFFLQNYSIIISCYA